jgi:XTP/dITP diphosphohydrolase
MKKILIATTNPSKFLEARSVLNESDLEIFNLKDFSNIEHIEETGDTFLENALLKAKGYFKQTGIPCIADDAGLMIDYLDGAPGVNSNRWLGKEASDEELAKAVLDKLDGVPIERRTARLGGFSVFYNGDKIISKENWVEGYITDGKIGEVKKGFPYRAVLMVSKFGKLYGELSEEEHEEVNFRRKNLRELKPEIINSL